jgi:hypothetical protein
MEATRNQWVVYSYCKQLTGISYRFDALTEQQKVDYLTREFPFASREAISEGVSEFEMARRMDNVT